MYRDRNLKLDIGDVMIFVYNYRNDFLGGRLIS